MEIRRSVHDLDYLRRGLNGVASKEKEGDCNIPEHDERRLFFMYPAVYMATLSPTSCRRTIHGFRFAANDLHWVLNIYIQLSTMSLPPAFQHKGDWVLTCNCTRLLPQS